MAPSNVWHLVHDASHMCYSVPCAESILAVQTRASVTEFAPDNVDDIGPDESEVLRLPATAPKWRRQLLSKLRNEWHVPETIIIVLFALRLRTWLAIIAWIAGAPLAHQFSVGPLYILGSLILVIFLNLGIRQAGEASAYSIYNNFQELPGQLNAHRLDDQMRRGQM